MRKSGTLTAALLIAGSTIFGQPALEWEKSFKSSSSTSKSEFNDVVATSDGGCIAVGTGKGDGGDMPSGYIDKGDALIIKMAADGTVQWSDYWGQQEEDNALAVTQTSDGGYAVAGYTYHFGGSSLGAADGFVVKYDATGTIQWQKIYGGSGHDLIYDIHQKPDGGYIFVGSTKSPEIPGYLEGSDLWAVMLDNTGEVVWNTAKGYKGEEAAGSVAQTSDGGFIVAGKTNSSDATNYKGGYDMWVMKLSATGNTSWQTCIGGTKADAASSVIINADGTIMVAGRTESNDKDISGNHSSDKNDLVMAHVDASGKLISTKVFGGTDDDATGFTDNQSIKQTADGGFALLTSTLSNDGDVSGNHGNYDFWLVKTDASGNLEWQQCLGATDGDYAHAVDVTSDGGYILAGQHSKANAWLVRMKGVPSDDSGSNIRDLSALNTVIYPNPTHNILNMATSKEIKTMFISDIMGREVLSSPALTDKSIDVSTLSPGMYFLHINFKDGLSGMSRIIKE